MAHVWSSKTIDAAQLADLYEWLDRIPLNKTRTNVEKDFADGLLTAEIVKYYFPDMVDMRDYRELQDVKDRIFQWKQLNSKIFHKIGLHVPNHVITQLSIAKTGIAQILLYNLRACLILYGANTNIVATPVILTEPVTSLPPVIIRPTLYEDPAWYKYYDRFNYLKDPLLFQNEYDYYWQKKQAERMLKSAKSRNIITDVPTKSLSNPTLPAILPRLPLTRNTYVVNQAVSTIGLTAAKLELDEKDQKILEKDDEIQFLKGQLKRMEVLLNNKNSKIQELILQMEKLRPVKK